MVLVSWTDTTNFTVSSDRRQQFVGLTIHETISCTESHSYNENSEDKAAEDVRALSVVEGT